MGNRMRKRRASDILDVLARVLHYQDSGEPETVTYEDAMAEHTKLPERIVQRYRNDPFFHAQVDRATAWVLRIVEAYDKERADG